MLERYQPYDHSFMAPVGMADDEHDHQMEAPVLQQQHFGGFYPSSTEAASAPAGRSASLPGTHSMLSLALSVGTSVHSIGEGGEEGHGGGGGGGASTIFSPGMCTSTSPEACGHSICTSPGGPSEAHLLP